MYYQGGSAIQATDDLHTLYLMNPSNLHQPHTKMSFLNSASASTTALGLDSQAPLPQAQQFVGIPLSQDPNRPSSIPGQQYEVHAPHGYQTIMSSFNYNLWRPVDDRDPNTSSQTPKCLSLSLSSDQTSLNKSLLNDQHVLSQSSIGMILPRVSTGVESMRGKVMRSKYLKAAQQILDEVANVGEDRDTNRSLGSTDKAKIIKATINGGKDGGAEKPTTAERLEIQMKKAKLVAMLNESSWSS